MAMTRILARRSEQEAGEVASEYRHGQYKVIRIGPTDKVELNLEGEPSLYWKGGSDADWYLVIATEDAVLTDIGS